MSPIKMICVLFVFPRYTLTATHWTFSTLLAFLLLAWCVPATGSRLLDVRYRPKRSLSPYKRIGTYFISDSRNQLPATREFAGFLR
ncbi:hypothetical protein IW261DRAFT_1458574 [Armillaria novae-zelandiae]|uniref:Uncharacterized protein n=1 Tax=Armillaria novae-zelandiae TaxID=153914 RepID=A0AA39PJL0_9AGAR|nr:hypothetical protein IW261DRAFT_1458574 [Armillaria novae-zelandiae]